MLGFFMNNPEKGFSTEELIEKFWKNEENADEEAVWLYVSFLRNKLRAAFARHGPVDVLNLSALGAFYSKSSVH